MAASYIFGGSTGETAESVKKKRAVAEVLFRGASGAAPKDLGSGLNAIGQAIAARVAMSRADKAEEDRAGHASRIMAELTKGAAAPDFGGSALSYDPAGAAGGASSIGADTSGAADLKPADREDYAMNYLVAKGLPAHQAAGIVGNLIQESSLNTGARNRGDGRDGSDSIGVGQWNGDRARGLRTFAANGGRNAGDLDTQLDYVLHELDGSESGAGKALRSAQNVDEATAAMIGYERPRGWSASNPTGGDGWGNRIGHAQRLMQGNYGAQASAAPVAAGPQASAAPVPSQQPVQVASLDPSIGMDTALAYNPRRGMDVPAVAQRRQKDAAVAAALKPLPATQEVAPNPVPPQAKFSPAIMAALKGDSQFDGFAQNGGNVQGAPAAPATPTGPQMQGDAAVPFGESQGLNMTVLAQLASDPSLDDGQREFAMGLLNRQYKRQDLAEARAFEARDPDNVMKRQYMQAQIDALGAKQPNTTDDTREFEYAKRDGYTGSFADWQTSQKRAGAQSITVGGGENKQVFDAMAESASGARAAVNGLKAIRDARSAIDAGGIFGAGADMRLGLQKIGAYLGVTDPAAITNTETFRASIAPQVAAMLKSTVGSANVSNSDRDFAERAAGGSIALEPASIKRLLGIMEKASTEAVAGHMSRLDKVYPGGGNFERERALFGVDMPDMSEMPPPAGGQAGDAPSPGGPQASPGQSFAPNGVPIGGAGQGATTVPRARNPQTGETIEFRNGQWVPVQ